MAFVPAYCLLIKFPFYHHNSSIYYDIHFIKAYYLIYNYFKIIFKQMFLAILNWIKFVLSIQSNQLILKTPFWCCTKDEFNIILNNLKFSKTC